MITLNGATYARMADSINPAALPAGMDAYLGYVDGRWPDYTTIAAEHGNVPCYGLDVFGLAAGDGTDSEPGDASIDQAVAATKADLARGVERPIVYCPLSWAQEMVGAHQIAGVPRAAYRLLTAHYTNQHICGPGCGYRFTGHADGTQWVDHGAWDESLLLRSFITAESHPGPVGPAMQGAPTTMLTDCVALVPTTSGKGYWEVQSDGGVFTHGDAAFHGSLGGIHLNAPIVDAARTAAGAGYWLVGADGGVFCFGDAVMHGSLGNTKLDAPIRGMAVTPTGAGYWLVGADGGVFCFGDAAFEGAGA